MYTFFQQLYIVLKCLCTYSFKKHAFFQKTRVFSKNMHFFKKHAFFQKTRIFSKNMHFSKVIHIFKNYLFFNLRLNPFFKIP